jgi:predicted NBD/HSP70 family sugar kinase
MTYVSMPTGVHALVRQTHEERVLRVLRENGAMSRGQLARAVGRSRATISEITGRLLQQGAIVVVDTDAAHREGSGRPAERLALDPASGQFMGVDFGHRRVHVAVADASHQIIASGSDRYEEDAPWPARIDVAFRLIDRLSADTGVQYGALQGIGIGVPGPYFTSRADRSVPLEATAPGFHEQALDVDVTFAARFAAPVIVDNNTRFAALAEAITSSGAADDLIYVRLSDGVGGGLVVGGRLVIGSVGLAGEFGHVTVEPDGRPCRCGKRGCLETVASVPAILAACQEKGIPVESLDDLRAAVERSHPVVDQILRDAAAALGRVVGRVAMAVDPVEIVIGGEITRVAPVIVQQVASSVAYEAFPGAATHPVVRRAELFDDDGALGALAALFHNSPLLAGYPEAADTTSRSHPIATEGAAHGRS